LKIFFLNKPLTITQLQKTLQSFDIPKQSLQPVIYGTQTWKLILKYTFSFMATVSLLTTALQQYNK